MQDDPWGSPSACWGLSLIPPPLPAEAFGSGALLVSCPELWLWAGKEAACPPARPQPQASRLCPCPSPRGASWFPEPRLVCWGPRCCSSLSPTQGEAVSSP